MREKLTITLVCIFGVLKKFRPGTPFLTPFLESPEFKNFTNEQVYGQIYTYWTYSNLLSMVPISLCIDVLRFKPILVLEGLLLLATWALLVFGTTVFHMQLMQICFGVATSADVAYYSYLYAVVSKKHYKQVTSLIRTASMLGKFAAYILGQLLISTELGDFLLLNQITLAVFLLCVPISLILPMAKKREKQQLRDEEEEKQKSNETDGNFRKFTTPEAKQIVKDSEEVEEMFELKTMGEIEKREKKEEFCDGDLAHGQKPLLKQQRSNRNVAIALSGEEDGKVQIKGRLTPLFERIEMNFLHHYRNVNVFHWSIWTILIQCGVYQVMNFEQSLWSHRKVDKSLVWNGLVEGVNTLLSAIFVFLLQFLQVKWEMHRFLIFVGSSLAFSALLFATVFFANIFADYTIYMLFYVFFNVLMAISSNLIATNMHSDAYGLVFGLNNFATVLSGTLFTFLLIDRNGPVGLGIEVMFVAFSLFFLVAACIFVLIEIVTRIF